MTQPEELRDALDADCAEMERQLADARQQLAKRDLDARRYRAMRWLAISQGDNPDELDAVADELMDQIPERD